MIIDNYPKLDLHGEECAMVKVLIETFLNDNYLLNNKYIVVIHGKSTNILTKEVHRVLKENKLVKIEGEQTKEKIKSKLRTAGFTK